MSKNTESVHHRTRAALVPDRVCIEPGIFIEYLSLVARLKEGVAATSSHWPVVEHSEDIRGMPGCTFGEDVLPNKCAGSLVAWPDVENCES
jgi:hypothetical protein